MFKLTERFVHRYFFLSKTQFESSYVKSVEIVSGFSRNAHLFTGDYGVLDRWSATLALFHAHESLNTVETLLQAREDRSERSSLEFPHRIQFTLSTQLKSPGFFNPQC